MKVWDKIPKAHHQALKNTTENECDEKLITLRDFHVGACIVSNMDLLDSCGNLSHQDHRSIRYVQCRGIHIYSNPCSGHLGCGSCPGMGSRGWSRERMGGLGGRHPG